MLLQASDACWRILKGVEGLHRRVSLLPLIQDNLKQLAFVIAHYDGPVQNKQWFFQSFLLFPAYLTSGILPRQV